MAVAFVGGAALGAAFGELFKVVVDVAKKTAKFKSILKRLAQTLRYIEPIFYEIKRLEAILHRPEEETQLFIHYLLDGKHLVLKCSGIQCWNLYKKLVYSNKLIELDAELVRFFQVNGQARLISTSLRIEFGINDLAYKFDRVLSAVTSCCGDISGSSHSRSGSYSVPELPDRVIGLDSHLEALKQMLLNDDDASVVVLSAPGGCGKTTLAKMICHDSQIKAKFYIFYVTVSQTTSFQTLVQKLFERYHGKGPAGFQSDEEAKNQLGFMMRQITDDILLVLDDVWPESEFVIKNLMFPKPGFKILVTSRFSFPSFHSTYQLKLLNDGDARTLLCYSAFPIDGIPRVSEELVTKIVRACKGFPLALTVIGASLCGQPEVKWRSTLKKWSEGQSIFSSSNDLRLSLQASVDALNEMPIVKECYLDLGSFPEDEKIAATALLDMWVESYNLDKEGIYTLDILLALKTRSLINLFATREDAREVEGYCNEHFVMQHDLLRELTIHLSSQEPVVQRKRLFLDINRNVFPQWWVEQNQQPTKTRLLSISTDDTFSSSWYDLRLPALEILILNLRTRKYALPHFMERLNNLKVLIITNYGVCTSELSNFPLIGSLSNLRRIRFQRVSIFSFDRNFLQLKNLQKISFIMCDLGRAFESCPTEIPYMLPNVAELEIDRCDGFKELPSQLCNIVSLEKLSITYCHELCTLPDELGRLTNLEVLILNSCTKLQSLPESIGNLHNLSFLDIADCLSMTELPLRMGELCGLRVLKMSGCWGLRELPTSVSDLLELEDVICDEETSYLWRTYEYYLENLKINVVQDDIFGSFMKVFSPSFH